MRMREGVGNLSRGSPWPGGATPPTDGQACQSAETPPRLGLREPGARAFHFIRTPRMLLARTLLRSALLTTSLAAAGLALAQTGAPPAPGGAAPAPAGDKVVARVDGTPITEADLALAAEDPALSLPNMDEAQKRDMVVGYLVDLKTGAKAAEAAKIGEGPAFARKLAYFRDKLLLDEYLDREVKKAVTPEAM